MHSSNGDQPLSNYETKLCNARSLLEILERGHPRVVNDLSIFSGGAHEHTKRIKAQGYGASYTIPMYLNGKFIGFLFFNSYEKDVFSEEALHYLDIFGHLISLFVINELNNIRTLIASVETTVGIVHRRDFETGSHLDRMSNYAKLIASTLARRHDLSDEAIEHIFLFAVLHDVGKIAIPDNILLKAGKLDAQEFDLMKNHVGVGLEIIDSMLQNFGIDDMQHVSVLRNIVHCHHEAVNGSGYPQGLQGDEIPMEARIVAVADAFDALTSKRPYKEAWSNEEAFSALLDLCGTKFDHDCVEALISKRSEVERIQKRFNEDP
jgi:HD-GYP domain-containing protein (c-di-GMP phosphodiesterase class II)